MEPHKRIVFVAASQMTTVAITNFRAQVAVTKLLANGNRIKKEKKVWEESCFQESKSVPVTPIVFCLSVDLDQSEALLSF